MQNDQELIDLFLQRKEEAISKTQAQYGRYCLHIAKNILKNRDDAEECLNSAWFKAWNAIPPTIPTNLKQFLAAITRNTAFHMYQTEHAEKRGSGEMDVILEELEECIAAGSDVEDTCFTAELSQAVNAFVHGLPQPERSVFVRRYYFADPSKVIAKAYGLSVTHVNVLLCRTRKKLRKELIKEGLFDE